jgi:hypothetical protein
MKGMTLFRLRIVGKQPQIRMSVRHVRKATLCQSGISFAIRILQIVKIKSRVTRLMLSILVIDVKPVSIQKMTRANALKQRF